MRSLTHHGITPTGDVHWDLTTPELYEHTIRRGEGELAHHGALVESTKRPGSVAFVTDSPDESATLRSRRGIRPRA